MPSTPSVDHLTHPVPARTIRARRLVALCLTLAVVVLDQLSKHWAVTSLAGQRAEPVVGELLSVVLVRNPGAAFSVGTSFTWIFTILSTVALVVVMRFITKVVAMPWAVCLGLVGGGVAGNLVDRLFRSPGFARGHVVDFLQLPHWPVFNVADSAICVAAGLGMVLAFKGLPMTAQPSAVSKDGQPDE